MLSHAYKLSYVMTETSDDSHFFLMRIEVSAFKYMSHVTLTLINPSILMMYL